MNLFNVNTVVCRHKGHHHPPEKSHEKGGSAVVHKKDGTREISVVRRVLDANSQMAEANRRHFSDHGLFVLNVMSSPGSGKTTTLVRTIKQLSQELRCAVIVGDICSTYDADQLSVTGVPVVQINTDAFGGDCHLAAHVIDNAAQQINLDDVDLLIVENIGNLVCPAEFDIGEDARVVILSVTEGEDKPIKYPLMFRECDVALLNKIDLLPYLEYDPDLAVANIHQVHPVIPVLPLSAQTGEGFDPWVEWILARVAQKRESLTASE